jgi:hypothetical protein
MSNGEDAERLGLCPFICSQKKVWNGSEHGSEPCCFHLRIGCDKASKHCRMTQLSRLCLERLTTAVGLYDVDLESALYYRL